MIICGLTAAGIGLAVAGQGLRRAQRQHRHTAALSGNGPDAWGPWFFGGIATVTMGLRGLRSVTAGAGWTLAGAWLIVLGVQVCAR